MVKEERAEEPPKQPEPAREEPLKSAAISLWHKIFGTPAEQTAKLAEERAEEKAAAPLEFREDPHDADRRTSVEVDEPVSAEQADELERGEDSASIGDERPRGRSRRRRGRGRGRRPETADVESELDEQFEGQTRTSQRADRKERRGDESDEELGGEEPSGAREPHEETDEGDEEELVGAGVSRRSVLQRAIPSWEEAIGFIVDANMQNRSQRKPPSRSGSREGGGGRGRSRGRRRPQ
jgi:hypothetical protein